MTFPKVIKLNMLSLPIEELPINFSARSVGSVDSNGKIINAKLISFDAISKPIDINYYRMKKLSKIKDIIDEKRINK